MEHEDIKAIDAKNGHLTFLKLKGKALLNYFFKSQQFTCPEADRSQNQSGDN